MKLASGGTVVLKRTPSPKEKSSCRVILKTPRILMHTTTLRTRFGKGTLWSLATALALCSVVSSQNGKPREIWDNPSAKFRSMAQAPLPNTDLPAQVQAVEGKLTLWADYASADQTSVPLYLVNRTGKEVSLPSQDHDLGIKLEFKKEGGEWTRAQSHIFSDCGNSYYPVKLPADHFFELRGYRAANGQKNPVRYAINRGDSQLISNSADGLVSPQDLSIVERDGLTLQKIPYPIYDAIDTCSYGSATPSGMAECMAVLRILPLFERNEALLDKVRALRDTLTQGPDTAEAHETIQAIDKVLSYQWPSEPAAVSITQFCKQRILDPSNAPSSSLPEVLAWRVLAENAAGRPPQAQKETPDELNTWKPLLEKAEQVMQRPDATPFLKATVANILGSARLVDPLVPDNQVIGWLKSPHKEFQSLGGLALVRRAKVEQLLRLAWDLSPEAQLAALGALSNAEWLFPRPDKNTPLPISDEEKRYWTHCFRTQPLESATCSFSGSLRMGDAVRLPLREFLIQEAKRGMASEKAFALDEPRDIQLPHAVRLLDRFNHTEDDALLRDLASHRGTRILVMYNQASERIEEAVPDIANAANDALKRRAYEAQARQQ